VSNLPSLSPAFSRGGHVPSGAIRPRHQRGRLGAVRVSAWLIGLVVAALLPLSPSGVLAAAHADGAVSTFDGKEIKDLCTISASGQSCPVFPAPPELLNPASVDAAGPQVAESIRQLEDQAVSNTLADHQLPASDREAVLSWGRAEAQGELWALIVDALTTSADGRTHVQKDVVVWMAGLVSAQSNESALHAGAEYATWAGLDIHRYWNMARTANQSDLQDFLSEPARARAPDGSPRGGYCRYTAPGPDSDAYDGSMAPLCHTACPSVQVCTFPVPTYDNFVSWGKDAAIYPTISSPAFRAQAAMVGATTALMVAGFSVGVAGFVLGPAGGATAVAVGSALYAVELAITGDTALSLGLVTGTEAAVATIGTAAATIGAILVVIASIVIATLEGIRITDEAAIPGSLAKLVVGARSTTSDPASLIGTTSGATALYELFVGATMPIPRLDLGCDNSLIPPWAYSSSADPNLLTYVPLGQNDAITSPTDRRGCLNPPPVPPAAQSDPHFVVTRMPDFSQSVSSAITLGDSDGDTAAQVRLHGTWFVEHFPQSGATTQSLQIHYLNWKGEVQTAWLVSDKGAYRFLGVSPGDSTTIDPDTCEADGTCWEKAAIAYFGPDSVRYIAKVEGYQAPTGRPTYTPSTPVEGSLVTFDADDFTPGTKSQLTYSWRFQRLGCGWLACLLAGHHDADGRAIPSYSAPVEGRTASYTWQSMGPAKVELTATDPMGHQAQTTFTVDVGNVAPTVTLDHAADSVLAGASFGLAGRFADAGNADDENVVVTWGDGQQSSVKAGPNSVNLLDGYHPTVVKDGATSFALRAQHTYAKPGTYYGTVQVSDWAGGTDSAAFTVTVTG
jgi:hypothetical protein